MSDEGTKECVSHGWNSSTAIDWLCDYFCIDINEKHLTSTPTRWVRHQSEVSLMKKKRERENGRTKSCFLSSGPSTLSGRSPLSSPVHFSVLMKRAEEQTHIWSTKKKMFLIAVAEGDFNPLPSDSLMSWIPPNRLLQKKVSLNHYSTGNLKPELTGQSLVRNISELYNKEGYLAYVHVHIVLDFICISCFVLNKDWTLKPKMTVVGYIRCDKEWIHILLFTPCR